MKNKLTNKQKRQYKKIVKEIIMFTMLLIACVSCNTSYSVTIKQTQPDQEQSATIETTTKIEKVGL